LRKRRKFRVCRAIEFTFSTLFGRPSIETEIDEDDYELNDLEESKTTEENAS